VVQDLRVYPEWQVHLGRQVLVDRVVQPVRPVCRVLQVIPDPPDLQAQSERPDHQALRVHPGRQDLPGPQDRLDLLDPPEQLDLMVLLDLREPQVLRDQQVLRDRRVRAELLEVLVRRVSAVLQDHPDQLVAQDQVDHQVYPE